MPYVKKNTIFGNLEKLGINHFIMVSKLSLKVSRDISGIAYSLFVLKRDINKKGNPLRLKFKDCEDDELLKVTELTDFQVNQFKERQDLYTKTIHNKEGRVYELKEYYISYLIGIEFNSKNGEVDLDKSIDYQKMYGFEVELSPKAGKYKYSYTYKILVPYEHKNDKQTVLTDYTDSILTKN